MQGAPPNRGSSSEPLLRATARTPVSGQLAPDFEAEHRLTWEAGPWGRGLGHRSGPCRHVPPCGSPRRAGWGQRSPCRTPSPRAAASDPPCGDGSLISHAVHSLCHVEGLPPPQGQDKVRSRSRCAGGHRGRWASAGAAGLAWGSPPPSAVNAGGREGPHLHGDGRRSDSAR